MSEIISMMTADEHLDKALEGVENAIRSYKVMQTKGDERDEARRAFVDARGLVEAVKVTKECAVKAVGTMHSCCYVNVKRMMEMYDKLIDDAYDMHANADNVLFAKSTQFLDAQQFNIRSKGRLEAACAAAGLSVTQVYDVFCNQIGHTAETIELVARMVKEEELGNTEADDEDTDDDRPKKRHGRA